MTGEPRALAIWAVTDGRAGIEAQALGLAEAVAAAAPAGGEIVAKRIVWRDGLQRLPTRLIPTPRLLLRRGSDALAPPWPDIWIACGRASIPASIAVRRWAKGRVFVVQVQDPVRDARRFDLVVPPAHDRLEGPNVFPILGAPHRVTPDRLSAERGRFAEKLDALPRPLTAVLVGGRSKAFDIPLASAHAIADAVEAVLASEGGAALVSFSRRTPARAQAAIQARLAGRAAWVWDGKGDNPYFAFLAAADRFLVTADSITMTAEAASTGKPVQILPVKGRQARKDRFHADLLARGAARPWRGVAEHWTYAPLRETERAAAEVLRRWTDHRHVLDSATTS
ncbi:MAG: mitochondrial fission ELM1 family protein [Caulobacteraceae bacterium]|nr:mitochondrial fission ELM1 family protein [Caulobacter sp.]